MASVLIPEHAFISYSHLDKEHAKKVRHDLEAAGIKTWMDEQIEPGTPDWYHALADAIEHAFAVVLIASPHVQQKSNVHEEVARAQSQQCLVIPVWIEGDDWNKSTVPGMGRAQYIDCRETEYGTGIAKLVKKLQETIDERSPAMQLLTKEEAEEYRKVVRRYNSTKHKPYIDDVTSTRKDYIYIELVNGDFVAIRYGAFDTLDELSEALYTEYLRKQYAPYMYGNQWLLGTYTNRYSTLMQLLVPWDWLSIPKNRSIAQLQSDWSNFPPDTWFASPHLHYLRVLDRLPQIAFGVATNAAIIIEKIRSGKEGYDFSLGWRDMINNHSQKRHWFGHDITVSERPEEVNPVDYQYLLVVASGEEDNMHDYVQPGEVTRVVCVI